MKKIFLFIAIVSITITSFANSITEKIETKQSLNNITIKFDSEKLTNEKIELNFDSMENLMNYDVSKVLNNYNIEDEECTASISVTVSVGVDSTFISSTVAVEGIPCDQIIAKVKELRAQLTEALN